jgi:hypothetical protein
MLDPAPAIIEHGRVSGWRNRVVHQFLLKPKLQ